MAYEILSIHNEGQLDLSSRMYGTVNEVFSGLYS